MVINPLLKTTGTEWVIVNLNLANIFGDLVSTHHIFLKKAYVCSET